MRHRRVLPSDDDKKQMGVITEEDVQFKSRHPIGSSLILLRPLHASEG